MVNVGTKPVQRRRAVAAAKLICQPATIRALKKNALPKGDVLTVAQIAGIQVNLPKASSSVALSQPKTKAISINNAGQIFLDAYPVTLPELEDRLRTEKALNPDFPVIVRGDAAVQYQKVVEVLDLMRKLELSQVGLVTGKPQG